MTQRKGTKLIAVNGRRMRITRLDSCGRLVYGDNAVAISGGFVSAKSSTNTTSTDAVSVTNANGDVLLSVAEQQNFSSFGFEIEFAEVDPELFALVTGNRVISDAFGNPVGFAVNSKVIPSNVAFALEIWTGAPSGDACATQGAQGSYGYFLLPFLSGGVLGDYEISQGAISFSITGVSSKDGNTWGVGPYKVVLNSSSQPAPLPAPLDPNDHLYPISTGVTPPDATLGTRPQLDPSATALTAITSTNTGFVYSFTATPSVAAGVGTQWDFGDGTWDYVTSAGSAVTKTYSAAGTYTVQASTNGTWVSKVITVSAS